MAVATKYKSHYFEVASLDTDYDYSDDFPNHVNGVRATRLQVVPSGKGDIFIVREEEATGPRICYCSSLNSFAPVVFDGGTRIKPYIAQADLTLAASANAAVLITLQNEG